MAIWRLVTHHAEQDRALNDSVRHCHIALGWSRVGNLRAFFDPYAISERAKEMYPDNRNCSVSGPQLWKFYQEMKMGDLVILSANGRRQRVMEVISEYVFDPEASDETSYAHKRHAIPVEMDANELWKQAGGMAPRQAIYWSLIRCARDPRNMG